mmetsp:Transcript_17588/g.24163  ORF Transcript_17588/g.24163 Transcript_17588/m.24163 type:complete len:138 (-) Transcript_17588:54-467(-)
MPIVVLRRPPSNAPLHISPTLTKLKIPTRHPTKKLRSVSPTHKPTPTRVLSKRPTHVPLKPHSPTMIPLKRPVVPTKPVVKPTKPVQPPSKPNKSTTRYYYQSPSYGTPTEETYYSSGYFSVVGMEDMVDTNVVEVV